MRALKAISHRLDATEIRPPRRVKLSQEQAGEVQLAGSRFIRIGLARKDPPANPAGEYIESQSIINQKNAQVF